MRRCLVIVLRDRLEQLRGLLAKGHQLDAAVKGVRLAGAEGLMEFSLEQSRLEARFRVRALPVSLCFLWRRRQRPTKAALNPRSLMSRSGGSSQALYQAMVTQMGR